METKPVNQPESTPASFVSNPLFRMTFSSTIPETEPEIMSEKPKTIAAYDPTPPV
ncbi:hypothetical protein LJR130_003645 [Variovorax sp. LjRoot130]|uniref:hypothetical protein n=1 Tax=Variovorax sp. LjRoot130 TaxID=3342261 RepID=UPI003ECF7737